MLNKIQIIAEWVILIFNNKTRHKSVECSLLWSLVSMNLEGHRYIQPWCNWCDIRIYLFGCPFFREASPTAPDKQVQTCPPTQMLTPADACYFTKHHLTPSLLLFKFLFGTRLTRYLGQHLSLLITDIALGAPRHLACN